MNLYMPIDEQDQSTLLEYKISAEREKGYVGDCVLDATQLAEIHMDVSALITKLELLKLRLIK